jgi:TPR repeat protein|nr:hypothetical protein [Aeromonas hydrophila]
MYPSIALLGDLGTDHDGFPPTPVIAASPDVFLDGKPVARQGDRMAQYRMGTLREEGLGAPRNRVHAYAWLSLAATEGMTEAVQARDELEAAMTKPEVKQAQKLSEHWFSKMASAVRNG